MKAIGYVRVSTEKQADFGVSLEAQAEKVRAMAVVQDAELVGTLPYGYRVAEDGLHLEADPAEQSMLVRVRQLRAAGDSTRQIAGELNREMLKAA